MTQYYGSRHNITYGDPFPNFYNPHVLMQPIEDKAKVLKSMLESEKERIKNDNEIYYLLT